MTNHDILDYDEPCFVISRCLNAHKSAHPVMSKATELRAVDLKVTNYCRFPPDWNPDSGNGILLYAHFIYRKAVDDIK